MPFGVELPDNLGEEPKAPEATEQKIETASESEQQVSAKPESTQTTEAQELMDLDKLEKFRFQGKEWSPKDLRDAYMMKQDYTKKTQELSETRKYVDNFAADLAMVREKPELINRLGEFYPPQYVELAKKLLARDESSHQESSKTPTQSPNSSDPEIEKIKSKFAEWEAERAQERQEREAARVKENESWLDNNLESMSRKYPEANREVVLARAQMFCDQNEGKLTEQDLEKIFKKTHDEFSATWEKRQKEKINKQLEAHSKTKDIGSGGGIPGGAPKGFKTIKEATAQFLADVKGH